MNRPQRVIVGISGASGASIGLRVVELLAAAGLFEIHLIVSAGGEETLAHEIDPEALARLEGLVRERHAIGDVGACVASGSFHTAGMIVAPCSVRTLSGIAACSAENLLLRAADVQLKERRRLVLVFRESPLHLGHIRAMAAVTEIGAILAPPAPAFYMRPQTVADVVDQIARRSIALLGLASVDATPEWHGLDTRTDSPLTSFPQGPCPL
ncbi:MAG: UbiX family flavin prenyltransferase [Alphaproteobacteria bacterium]